MIEQHQVWVEKFRPTKIDDCILPEDIKSTFNNFVKQKYIPNLILSGGPGVGKTTVAKAMLSECGFDSIMINGSLNGGIDTLRFDIKNFASTVSFTDTRKYVILDEADYLSPLVQSALRNFMEEYSKNCGFILTCNYKNKIIEPLHSRCSVIEFKIDTKNKSLLASKFMRRVENILESENIPYDKKVVAALIIKHFPDWRRILNELQRFSATGKIDSDILVSFSDDNFKKLVGFLKSKNFTEMRKWVAMNTDIEATSLYRKLYDTTNEYIKDQFVPQLVLHIANYSYKGAFVADPEVNLVACLTEIMSDVEFK